jgi:transposase
MVTRRNKGIVQHHHLRKVWECAVDSIGCQAGIAMELEARMLVETYIFIKEQITDLDKAIENLCQHFEDYKRLQTIPGFGPYIAAVVLAAIGNPLRFENTSQLIKLAGFDLNANRSGKKSASIVPVITKKGKTELRYALYQAARIASSLTALFRAYYHRLVQGRQREQGIHTKMRVKLATKLLVIAWTLMKKKELFDPAYLRI